MAELAGSIIGIVSAGTKVTLVLFQLASDVGSAAKEARMIANEISSFCAVVKTLGETLEKVQNSQYYAHCNEMVGDMTAASLEMFSEILDACKTVMDISRGKDGKFGLYGRMQWVVFKKPKVMLLRAGLEAYKSNLALMLGTLNTTEKVTRRMSLPVTPEVVAEEEQDRAVLQNLENQHRASLVNVEQTRRLVEQDNEPEEWEELEKEVDFDLPSLTASPGTTPDPSSPATYTNSLLGSARDAIDSIRSSLSTVSTFDSDVLPDQLSRHSKALSQLMFEDQHRMSQRWSLVLDPVVEHTVPAVSGGYQPVQQNNWDFDRNPEPYSPPHLPSTKQRARSPVPSPGRESVMSDAFYGIVRTWLLEKPLEDRRIVLGTLMNEVCVAQPNSQPKSKPKSPNREIPLPRAVQRSPRTPIPRTPIPRTPVPRPPEPARRSPNPQPNDTQFSDDALDNYLQKAKEIHEEVKKQVIEFTVKNEADGFSSTSLLADAPGLTIDLGHRKILKLPHEIVDVLQGTLERISLSNNRLADLPVSIAICSRLRYINLRGNNFVTIPDPVLDLPQLEILDMSKNLLSVVPESLAKVAKTLKVFSVEKNNITELPFVLAEMTELLVLKYDGNPLLFPIADEMEALHDLSSIPLSDESNVPKLVDLPAYRSTQRLKRYLAAYVEAESLDQFDDAPAAKPTPAAKPLRKPRSPRYPVVPAIQNGRSPTPAPSKSPDPWKKQAFNNPKRDTFDLLDMEYPPKPRPKAKLMSPKKSSEAQLTANETAMKLAALSTVNSRTPLNSSQATPPKNWPLYVEPVRQSDIDEVISTVKNNMSLFPPGSGHQRSHSQEARPTTSTKTIHPRASFEAAEERAQERAQRRRSYLDIPQSKRNSKLIAPALNGPALYIPPSSTSTSNDNKSELFPAQTVDDNRAKEGWTKLAAGDSFRKAYEDYQAGRTPWQYENGKIVWNNENAAGDAAAFARGS